jgi:hypothetical protein
MEKTNKQREMRDALKLFEPQVFRNDQDLLSMLVRPQDLSTLANNQNTVISIKQTKQIIGVGNDISTRMLIRRYSVNLHFFNQ